MGCEEDGNRRGTVAVVPGAERQKREAQKRGLETQERPRGCVREEKEEDAFLCIQAPARCEETRQARRGEAI